MQKQSLRLIFGILQGKSAVPSLQTQNKAPIQAIFYQLHGRLKTKQRFYGYFSGISGLFLQHPITTSCHLSFEESQICFEQQNSSGFFLFLRLPIYKVKIYREVLKPTKKGGKHVHYSNTIIEQIKDYYFMSLDPQNMKLDELARNLCKPLGCKVVACLDGRRPGGCGPQMAALNQCISRKRRQIDEALASGRSLKTIQRVDVECGSEDS